MFLIILFSMFFSYNSSHIKIDPKIEIYLKSPEPLRAVMMNPFNPVNYKFKQYAPISVRLKTTDDFAILLQKQNSHLKVLKRDRKYVKIENIVAMHTDLQGLNLLKSFDFIVRVELDTPPHSPSPLDVTSHLITAPETWVSISNLLSITGKNIVIGDIDSGLDLFQPSFFKADGGYFAWIDVNNDGKLTPDIDVVDFNGNGIQDSEDAILRYIDTKIYPLYGDYPVDSYLGEGSSEYMIGRDILYVDSNNNGVRDNDVDLGNAQDTPSLGEQFFVVDDVNSNGIVDVNEKIVMLNTSKVKAIYQGEVTRTRSNKDLHGVELTLDNSHGTGVCGILVGGNVGFSKYLGIAPDADIVMAQNTMPLSQLFSWVLEQGANVVLHEYAPWTGHFLDGGDNIETALDNASSQGIIQINPAGNLGGSSKGYKSTLNISETKTITLTMPSSQPASYAQITFLWRNPAVVPSFVLDAPGGIFSIDMNTPTNNFTQISGQNIWYTVIKDTSTRGTSMIDVVFTGWDGANYSNLPTGTYTVTVQHPGASYSSIDLNGFVSDVTSGWGEGFKWNNNVTEEHLIGYPGTADSAITIAAYTGRDEPELDMFGNNQGELRRYSGRGHRIDNVDILDIAAPANPISSACSLCVPETSKYGHYRVFGGTSGAGPHVAGAAALLKQLYPTETGTDIKNRIRNYALVDSDVLTPGNLPQSDLWGAGKLRIYEAAYGIDPPAISYPTISCDEVLYEKLENGQIAYEAEVFVSNVNNQDAIKLAFDFDYDGEWDTEIPISPDNKYNFTFDFSSSDKVAPYVKIKAINADVFSSSILVNTVESYDITNDVDEDTNNDINNDYTDATDLNNHNSTSNDGCQCSETSGHNFPMFLFLVIFMFFVVKHKVLLSKIL